jgi:FtsP/CotA-like multicopper oxidase with cupredoxin domain
MIIHGPATANYDIDAGSVMIDDLFGSANKTMTAAEANGLIAHYGPAGTWNYILNGHNTSPDLSRGKHALWTVQPGKKYRFRLINSASQNMWAVHFDNHKMTVIATDWVPVTPYTTEWLNIGIGQRYDVGQPGTFSQPS